MNKTWEEMTPEEQKAAFDAANSSVKTLEQEKETLTGKLTSARQNALDEKKKYDTLYEEVFTTPKAKTKEPPKVKSFDDLGIK